MFKLSVKKNPILYIVLIILLLMLNGCSVFKKDESVSDLDYKELKEMVIDILQTEDGKKIIEDTIQDPSLKKEMVLNDQEVKKIVEEEFLSPENKEKLKSMYEDPEFASKLAEILKEENEKLLKDLMKDPEYRKMMIETMQDKEFEKIIVDIMKSNEYRSQMKLVIKETLQSPLFKSELIKLFEEASKKTLEGEDKKDDTKEEPQKEDEK